MSPWTMPPCSACRRSARMSTSACSSGCSRSVERPGTTGRQPLCKVRSAACGGDCVPAQARLIYRHVHCHDILSIAAQSRACGQMCQAAIPACCKPTRLHERSTERSRPSQTAPGRCPGPATVSAVAALGPGRGCGHIARTREAVLKAAREAAVARIRRSPHAQGLPPQAAMPDPDLAAEPRRTARRARRPDRISTLRAPTKEWAAAPAPKPMQAKAK